MDPDPLLELLRRHWGHEAFRPAQRQIVESILAGRDVVAVLPTGGGKSLCYQLPAVALNKTCIVISPLIALMQDQAGHLREARIPAAALNSAQDWQRNRAVAAAAEQGRLRLLYISPERLLREDSLNWLRRIPVGLIAIDEAHCISEWGHEFRPEYRQLRVLREALPDVPIAAFTASATRRVRHDIVAQLQLRDPAKFVRSFHRPNLRIVIRNLDGPHRERYLFSALSHITEGRVIVYAPTIRDVEAMAEHLSRRGFPAIPYHGQMDTEARRQNQDLWMRGAPRILVGTIAFGLGINQPQVRAVIHLALPKSLEQYYQEAGRAGRDGAPADCILLWRNRDIGLQAHFIEELQDDGERRRAWDRLRTMRAFAEGAGCHHRLICEYFGETPKWDNCGACDACGYEPEYLQLPAPTSPAARARTPVDASDPRLARLRAWRTGKARELKIPPFMILHDRTLTEILLLEPELPADLLAVKGLGKAKVERWGEEILAALE